MTTGSKRVVRLYGPWRGLNEWPGECQPGEVEDAWNVDFDGDLITTRPGRRLVLGGTVNTPVMVTACHRYGRRDLSDTAAGGLNRTDFSREVSDGSSSTYAQLGKLGAATGSTYADRLYIGFAAQPQDLTFILSDETKTNNVVSTMTLKYYKRGTGYTALTITDGTANASKTLKASGTVSWTAPTDWVPSSPQGLGTDGGRMAPVNVYQGKLYWLELTVSTTLSSDVRVMDILSTVNSASGVSPWQTVDLAPNGNGLFQWNTLKGESLLLLGLDDTAKGVARLFEVDQYMKRLKPLSLQGDAAVSGPDAWWSFAAVPGIALFACNGYTLLYATEDQPRVFRRIEPADILDGSFASRPPQSARFVAFAAGRLLVSRREAPNEVYMSEPALSDEALVRTSVRNPLGGLAAWDPNSSVSVSDRQGSGVTGIVPLDGRVVVFTEGSTWAFDPADDLPIAQCLDPDVGCLAPRSIGTMDGACFFLGPGPSVYRFAGGANQVVSRRVEPTLRMMDPFKARSACGVIYRKRNQYRLYFPAGVGLQNADVLGENDTVLVWNYARGSWTKYGIPWWSGLDDGVKNVLAYRVRVAFSGTGPTGERLWELCPRTTAGTDLYVADVGDVDNNGSVQAIPWFVAFDRLKFEDQGVATARFARIEHLSGGPTSTIGVGLLVDGADHRKHPSLYDEMRLVDTVDMASATVGMADQAYGLATIGTDAWRTRKWRSGRASFGSDGRTLQLALTNIINGVIGEVGTNFAGAQGATSISAADMTEMVEGPFVGFTVDDSANTFAVYVKSMARDTTTGSTCAFVVEALARIADAGDIDRTFASTVWPGRASLRGLELEVQPHEGRR